MASKSKRKLKDMTLDDFVNNELGASDGSDVELADEVNASDPIQCGTSKGIKNGHKKKEKRVAKKTKSSGVDASTKHKQDLDNLKSKDPEFYAYLKENDENLLNFDVSDSSNEDADDVDDKRKGSAKSSKQLQPTLDAYESEDDVDDGNSANVTKVGKATVVTMRMVNEWTTRLQAEEPSTETLQAVIEVFKAAVVQVQGHEKSRGKNEYIVDGSSTFNSIMRLCVVHLLPALNRMLRISDQQKLAGVDSSALVASCRRWPKIQAYVKLYLNDLVKILAVVAEPAIVSVLLKHVVQLVPYITAVGKYAKSYLKRLIYFWSIGEETVRVLSFIAIIKITRALPEQFHDYVVKSMYMAYVKNSKFTSPSTWPLINFMKRSLVEVFALNESIAYQYAFVYIRQLAIHLRNAVTTKKKDSMKSVYNWQYIHCLNFLAQLLATLHSSEALKPLIYPLVQTIVGTINLVSAAKYYPLRFQCVRALILVSRETGTFIPILPLLTEILEMTDFNKKSQRSSWKPLEFNCMLKLSKAQLCEQGFREGVLDQLYELLMDYLSTEAHTVGFPELVLPTVLLLRAFVKSTKVASFSKLIKQIMEKINENSKFIVERRQTLNVALSDSKAIEAWESHTKLSVPPLTRYYESYRKLRDREIARVISRKEQVDGQNLPEVDRRKLMAMHKLKEREDIVKLFDESDSDEDLFTKKMKEMGADDDDDQNAEGRNSGVISDLKVVQHFDDNECADLVDVTSSSDDDDDG